MTAFHPKRAGSVSWPRKPFERIEIDEWTIDLEELRGALGLDAEALAAETKRRSHTLQVIVDVKTRLPLAYNLQPNDHEIRLETLPENGG